MPYDGLLITVDTQLNRYIVRRDQILELRMIISNADLERPDERGKALVAHELGALLDAEDRHGNARRHALVVPTRRRSVALLVDRVEDFRYAAPGIVQPLVPLLRKRLARPWFLGVVVQDDTPFLVLDLRQIAQDVLLMQVDPATYPVGVGANATNDAKPV